MTVKNQTQRTSSTKLSRPSLRGGGMWRGQRPPAWILCAALGIAAVARARGELGTEPSLAGREPAASPSGRAAGEERRGVRLFYRMLGSSRNAPLLPRTRSVCAPDGSERTSSTGMAESGFTEFPFNEGLVSYTFSETYAYFPRIASGVPIDPARTNVGDIAIDHVYEPDACVWGPSAREFVQTFVATGRELVSVTLLVASGPGSFRAALIEGGPGGRALGPVRSFRSGHSLQWGWARWNAGDAPLEPGRTYGIRLWREDGRPWQPYLHATGDAYADGLLFADGRPLPESDLGAWIIEEPPDLSRAIVEDAVDNGNAGTVFATREVIFRPRTPNIRLVSLGLSPAREKCREPAIRIWSTDDPPCLVAGPKRNLACAEPGSTWDANFLFADGECSVTPGERYRIEVFTLPHPFAGAIPAPRELPAETLAELFDVRAWIYGEPEPGALPAIHDLRATVEGESDVRLSWSVPFPCQVTAELTRLGPHEVMTKVVEPDTPVGGAASPGTASSQAMSIVFPKLWRGHEHALRLVARGPTGLQWRTPRYRIFVPGGPRAEPFPPVWPDHPEAFLPLAPPATSAPSSSETIRCRRQVPLVNPGFEDGLAGWSASPAGIVRSVEEERGIGPPEGRRMAGWSAVAGERREQVFEVSRISQEVATTPGHAYLLSVRAITTAVGGPRGDTRIRLLTDGRGGDAGGGRPFEGPDATRWASQWYWTDGRWLRFERRFVAEGDTAAVGIGFFRWRDIDLATAHVDRIVLFDLGPASRDPLEPLGAEGGRVKPTLPTLALVEPRTEADDRTEAYLNAPPGCVITGLGARAAGDNVTTFRLRVRELRTDGTLGEEEELLNGWEPDAGLEASVDLPDGYVATGFGARIAPEWDVKTLAVWARPLGPGGTLGEEREFRAGVQPEGGLEKQVRLEPGRVLTGGGLRCSFNDVAGIRAVSARLILTAVGAAKAAGK